MNIAFTLHRLSQVLKYGWKHAGVMATKHQKNHIQIFIDMLYCYNHYKLWTNQYVKENFCTLNSEQRNQIGNKYLEEGTKRDAWQKEYMETKYFLAKWTSRKWDPMDRVIKRNKAYTERFNAGPGLFVESNVELSRQHYLWGTIKIGKNVLLAKNVFIDYTGHVTLEDNVKLANGVIIESHHRDLEAYEKGLDVNIQSSILIREGAYIGSRAIILSSCHYIGKNARIGAGAVVTKDVPDYALVAGVPAKVIKMLNEENK